MRSAVRRRVRLQLCLKTQGLQQHEIWIEHKMRMHDLLVRLLGLVKAEGDPKEGVYEHGNIGSKECCALEGAYQGEPVQQNWNERFNTCTRSHRTDDGHLRGTHGMMMSCYYLLQNTRQLPNHRCAR
jgi:hypothetical protein